MPAPLVALIVQNLQTGIQKMFESAGAGLGQVRFDQALMATDEARFFDSFRGRHIFKCIPGPIQENGLVALIAKDIGGAQVRLFQSLGFAGWACGAQLSIDEFGTAEGDVNAPTGAVVI